MQLNVLQVPAHKSTITMLTENPCLRMEFSIFLFYKIISRWTWSWAACYTKPCLSWGIGLDDLHWSPFNLSDSVEMLNSIKEMQIYLGFYFHSKYSRGICVWFSGDEACKRLDIHTQEMSKANLCWNRITIFNSLQLSFKNTTYNVKELFPWGWNQKNSLLFPMLTLASHLSHSTPPLQN